MGSVVGSMALMVALSSSGGIFFNRNPNNHVLPPLPGDGAGFPNGNPDGYGWFDIGDKLPLGADRTSDYYFRRYNVVTPTQMFMPNYYNPYISRGQRFLPYTGCGGLNPTSGPPTVSARESIHPYQETLNTKPRISVPSFTGRVEAPPVNPGTTGLRP